jgi:hypothetical protein
MAHVRLARLYADANVAPGNRGGPSRREQARGSSLLADLGEILRDAGRLAEAEEAPSGAGKWS